MNEKIKILINSLVKSHQFVKMTRMIIRTAIKTAGTTTRSLSPNQGEKTLIRKVI